MWENSNISTRFAEKLLQEKSVLKTKVTEKRNLIHKNILQCPYNMGFVGRHTGQMCPFHIYIYVMYME